MVPGAPALIYSPRSLDVRLFSEALDGLDGQQHQVIYQTDFLLDEWLSITNAGEQAIVAGGGEGALANVVFRNKETDAGGLISVLRAIGEQGLETLLDVWRDVDDEGWPDVGVERGVEDLVRAVGRVCGAGNLKLAETADETGFVTEDGSGVVVGMTTLPVRKYDNAGAQTAKNSGDLQAVGLGIFDIAVGKVEGLAVLDLEDARGCFGFGASLVGCAAGSGLALSKIEDAGTPAPSVHGE